jgi:hypothetical protein
MKVLLACLLVLSFAVMGSPAIARYELGGSNDKAVQNPTAVDAAEDNDPMPDVDAAEDNDPMPDVSPNDPIDDVQGRGTSAKLAAQGTVGYDDNTGMMNVVPSDSVGDLEN